jgi:hypothetical protein
VTIDDVRNGFNRFFPKDALGARSMCRHHHTSRIPPHDCARLAHCFIEETRKFVETENTKDGCDEGAIVEANEMLQEASMIMQQEEPLLG